MVTYLLTWSGVGLVHPPKFVVGIVQTGKGAWTASAGSWVSRHWTWIELTPRKRANRQSSVATTLCASSRQVGVGCLAKCVGLGVMGFVVRVTVHGLRAAHLLAVQGLDVATSRWQCF